MKPHILPVNESTYMLSVSIRVGRGMISLKSDDLKDQELAAALRANGVKSKDTLPVFEANLTPALGEWVKGQLGMHKPPTVFSLQAGGVLVSSLLDRLQRKYMLCGVSRRWWFVLSSNMDSVDLGFAQMQELRTRVLTVLEGIYDPAKELYETRLANVLTAANRLNDFERYAAEFPTPQEIEREFRIEVDGRIPVPSVVELAKQSPDMQRWMGDIRKQLTEELPRINDEICGLAADLVGLVEKNQVKATETRLERINGICERLEVLEQMYASIAYSGTEVDHDDQVLRLAQQVQWMAQLEKTAVVDQSLIDLRRWLSLPDNTLLVGRSAGCRKLAQWVNGRNAEEEYRAVVAELKALKDVTPDPDQLSLKLSELKERATRATIQNQAQGDYVLQLLDRLIDVGVQVPETQAKLKADPEFVPVLPLADVVEVGF